MTHTNQPSEYQQALKALGLPAEAPFDLSTAYRATLGHLIDGRIQVVSNAFLDWLGNTYHPIAVTIRTWPNPKRVGTLDLWEARLAPVQQEIDTMFLASEIASRIALAADFTLALAIAAPATKRCTIRMAQDIINRAMCARPDHPMRRST